jgi:hydrogenase nickel incorporation protein HypB
LIENVGNLICPALFDLGESAKVVVASVAEGDDKPEKYPYMFQAASLVILNKCDLLPSFRSMRTASSRSRARSIQLRP